MFRTRYVCLILLLAAALLPVNLMGHSTNLNLDSQAAQKFDTQKLLAGFTHAAFAAENGDVRASKAISFSELEKYKSITVTADDGGADVKYEGVPLRALIPELMPDADFDSMKGRKALSQKKLVAELTGDDGYPGLVTTLDIATNKDGDRFILATKRDGKQIDGGPQLICRLDTARTRWVREVVQLRIVEVPDAEKTEAAK